MPVYVYRKAASNGARDLAEALGGRRYRGTTIPITSRLRAGDVVVCWGQDLAPVEGVRILNGGPIRGKYEDAVKLKEAGVPTIEVSRSRPVQQPQPLPVIDPALAAYQQAQYLTEEFTSIGEFRRTPPLVTGVGELHTAIGHLFTLLRVPAPLPITAQVFEWLPRSNSHIGGSDLLRYDSAPGAGLPADYWVKKLELVNEYRIHSFLGKSIRAGKKAPREGMTPHSWIRSWDGGWRIAYDGVSSTQAHRTLAHRACQALGLDFAAVDLGERADGSLLVLEANRRPGIEAGTIDSYADSINRWTEERD